MTRIDAGFAADLIACDWVAMPPALRAHMFQSPAASVPVTQDGPLLLQVHASLPPFLFAKLATKSWRDAPRLPVLDGTKDPADLARDMLAQTTPQQSRLMDCLHAHNHPVVLHLYPWIDFTHISEHRIRFGPNGFKASSAAHRGASAEHSKAAAQAVLELAKTIRPLTPLTRGSMDFTVDAEGQIACLEVNPSGAPEQQLV